MAYLIFSGKSLPVKFVLIYSREKIVVEHLLILYDL